MLELSIFKQFPGFSLETSFSLGKETMLLCGPSGSGKTTLLRCLAGLAAPDRGYILFNDRYYYKEKSINLPPAHRQAALMSQGDTLFPHLTVRQNILYTVPRNNPVPPLYDELLQRLQLAPLERCFPATLSGGEKRRAMLARTLMRCAAMLMLDEPFAGLDSKMCRQVAALICEYCSYYKPVLLIATHVQQELIHWAARQLTLEDRATIAV